MKDNKMEGITSSMSTEEVGYLQDVAGKKKSLVKFKYGHKRDMSSCSLLYLHPKEEICQYLDEPIFDIPKKEKGELLTIDGNTVFE